MSEELGIRMWGWWDRVGLQEILRVTNHQYSDIGNSKRRRFPVIVFTEHGLNKRLQLERQKGQQEVRQAYQQGEIFKNKT